MPDWLNELMLEVLPEHVSQKVRVRRRGQALRAAGVAMIHVPRTAGTSLSRALYGHFIGHYAVRDLLVAAPRDVRALPRFAIVRNPWDRLVSAWSFARAGGGAADPDNMRIRVRHPELYNRPEFGEFSAFVEDWLRFQRLESLDGIFRTQASFVTDRQDKVALDHLGRFEALDQTAQWLEGILKRPVVLGTANRSERSDYRDYYSPGLQALVGDLYAEDIDRFGYKF